MRLRFPRFVYRFIRSRVVLLLPLGTRSGRVRQDGLAVARADLYRFVDMVDAALGHLMSSELGYVTELVSNVDQEDGIMYSLLEDEREDRSLLRGRVKMLFRDRPYHRRTALLMEEEARVSHLEITELRAADRRRQAAITKMLAADRRRQKQLFEALKLLKKLQVQMIEFQRQQGPANGSAHPEVPEEAGSSS
ncbi:hypothetical protein Tco_1480411 [Tanacetum coccineum]